MITITEGLATGGTSDAWETKFDTDDMYVDVTGTFASETFTMEYKNFDGSWVDFTFDSGGSTATFAANSNRKFSVAGGLQFRLTGDSGGGGTTDVNVRVSGHGVDRV